MSCNDINIAFTRAVLYVVIYIWTCDMEYWDIPASDQLIPGIHHHPGLYLFPSFSQQNQSQHNTQP